jgi:hypothetical protein
MIKVFLSAIISILFFYLDFYLWYNMSISDWYSVPTMVLCWFATVYSSIFFFGNCLKYERDNANKIRDHQRQEFVEGYTKLTQKAD